MFDILFTDEALAIYKDLEDKAEKKSNKKITKNSHTVGLLKQIKKTLNFLIRNPRHPGLHTHEYSGLKTHGILSKRFSKHMFKIAYQKHIDCFGVMEVKG